MSLKYIYREIASTYFSTQRSNVLIRLALLQWSLNSDCDKMTSLNTYMIGAWLVFIDQITWLVKNIFKTIICYRTWCVDVKYQFLSKSVKVRYSICLNFQKVIFLKMTSPFLINQSIYHEVVLSKCLYGIKLKVWIFTDFPYFCNVKFVPFT